MISFQFPAEKSKLSFLQAGDFVKISGTLYTARDQAHRRFIEMMQRGEELPVSLKNNCIYYCGPTPPREDGLFGSAGPTTSARMDSLSLPLFEKGLCAVIGKGGRSSDFNALCKKFGVVYFHTFGGAGAYLAKCIVKQKVIAFEDLGAEAIFEIEVKDFPAVVATDSRGKSVF